MMKKSSINKRPRLMKSSGGSESQGEKDQLYGPTGHRPNSMEMGGLTVTPSNYNPLDELFPLGLRLKKSQSLLELIQTNLSQSSAPPAGGPAGCSRNKVLGPSSDRLKASGFHATLLRIGTWEYKSRHQGDLVAKCYYASRKLVWEVLDGGLKKKIEIKWSDIVGLKKTSEDNARESLTIVLERQPILFREVDPKPRKHTLWLETTDFTGGQASTHRQHFLECPRGSMGKHIEKIINCDPHMMLLYRQNHDLNEEGSCSIISSQDAASGSGVESLSSKKDVDSTIDMPAAGDSSNNQGTSTNPTFPSEEWQSLEILENINRSLLSDVEYLDDPDENLILSRVNSLCRLLQNDDNNSTFEHEDKSNESIGADENLKNDNMLREDSVGDLLWNLPRVASLPNILLNISESGGK